jgi:hypothetical protein
VSQSCFLSLCRLTFSRTVTPTYDIRQHIRSAVIKNTGHTKLFTMSVLRSSYFIPSLLCFIFLSELRFGTSLSLGDISKLSRREALARFPVATIILPVLLDIVPSRAHAAGFQDDLRSSLKPDSDDQPRIPLPTGQDPQSETTVVEGTYVRSFSVGWMDRIESNLLHCTLLYYIGTLVRQYSLSYDGTPMF